MSAPGPALLDGLVVLDFTRVLAGPYCTRLLADLGARVIKIERPGEGDEMRRAHLQLEEGRDDQSTYFTRINTGKESLALDLALPPRARWSSTSRVGPTSRWRTSCRGSSRAWAVTGRRCRR